MLSGIFRRRVVVIAAGLMAGAALGAGVPSLVLHNPHSSAAAATTSITLTTSQFGELTFAKLGGITLDEQDQQSCSSGTCTYTPTVVPPTITLREPYAANIATYQDMLTWETEMRDGNPEGRMDATLTLTNSAGTTIASYVLENAWLTNVDVPAGNPQSVSFTVTLTGDNLEFVSG
jgi:hypothetical protein